MIAGSAGGLTGFWCTDGYAVCGYAEAAGTSKDIVVSVDEVGVSKTPGLRVNAPPSARSRPIRIGCSAGLGTGSAECCVFSSLRNHLLLFIFSAKLGCLLGWPLPRRVVAGTGREG